LDGVRAALEMVHRAWEAVLQETLARLDHLVAQTDETLRLTRVLVARWPRPARPVATRSVR